MTKVAKRNENGQKGQICKKIENRLKAIRHELAKKTKVTITSKKQRPPKWPTWIK